MVTVSDKSLRVNCRQRFLIKKTMACFKHIVYQPRTPTKTFGLSGLAEGSQTMTIRQKRRKKRSKMEWKKLVASNKGAQDMPSVRPLPRLESAKRQKISGSLFSPRRHTSRPLDTISRCTFQVNILIGYFVNDSTKTDRWIMQVVNSNHCGHFPHKCNVAMTPLRLKDQHEVNLAVQVNVVTT